MLTGVVKNVSAVLSKNSPGILTAIATAGVITTAVLAVRATPRALEILENERLNNGPTFDPPGKLDTIKLVWKCYIPSISMAAITIGCLVGINSVHGRRTAALASAYSLAEKGLEEYQRKVVEHMGAKKEMAVRDDIAQDHLNQNPVSTNQVVVTGKGETLCYDDISGRYFKSNMAALEKAENVINKKLVNWSFVCVNELYSVLGLDPISIGDELGWVTDNLLEFNYSAKVADDGTPCIVLGYAVDPKYNPHGTY